MTRRALIQVQLVAVRLNPSPLGRRWPEGTDEGDLDGGLQGRSGENVLRILAESGWLRRQKRDNARTQALAAHGIAVVRFWNDAFLRDVQGTLEAMRSAVQDRWQALGMRQVLPR